MPEDDSPRNGPIETPPAAESAPLETAAEKLHHTLEKPLEVAINDHDKRTKINNPHDSNAYGLGIADLEALAAPILASLEHPISPEDFPSLASYYDFLAGLCFLSSATGSSYPRGGTIDLSLQTQWKHYQDLFASTDTETDGLLRVNQQLLDDAQIVRDAYRDHKHIDPKNHLMITPSGTHFFAYLRALVGGSHVTFIGSPESGTDFRKAAQGDVTFAGYNILGEPAGPDLQAAIHRADTYQEVPLRDTNGHPINHIEEKYINTIKQQLEQLDPSALKTTLFVDIAFPGKGGKQSADLYEFSRQLTSLATAINNHEALDQLSEPQLKNLITQLGGIDNLSKVDRFITIADAAQSRLRAEYQDIDLVAQGYCLALNDTKSKAEQYPAFAAIAVLDPWIIKQANVTEAFARNFIGVGYFEEDTQLRVEGQIVDDINQFALNAGNLELGTIMKLTAGLPLSEAYYQHSPEDRNRVTKEINQYLHKLILDWGIKTDWRGERGRTHRAWCFNPDDISNWDTPSILSLSIEDMRVIRGSLSKPIDGKKFRELLKKKLAPPPDLHTRLPKGNLPESLEFLELAAGCQVEIPNFFAESSYVDEYTQTHVTEGFHREVIRLAQGLLNQEAYFQHPEAVQQALRLLVAKMALLTEFADYYQDQTKVPENK